MNHQRDEHMSTAEPERDEPPLTLRERIEALAYALWVAGIRSGDKDGRPRLIAEGVYANLNKVQRLDICRITAADVGTRLAAALAERDRELAAAIELLREQWRLYGPKPSNLGPHYACTACGRASRLPDTIKHANECAVAPIGAYLAAYDARRAPAPAAPAKEST